MDINDIPFLVLGAAASIRDDSIKTTDDMVKKGREIATATRSKVKTAAQDKKIEATLQELVNKGKKDQQDLVEAVGRKVRETLDSLGIVTKNDVARLEARLSEVENKLAGKKATAKKTTKKAAKKPASKAAAVKPAKKKSSR